MINYHVNSLKEAYESVKEAEIKLYNILNSIKNDSVGKLDEIYGAEATLIEDDLLHIVVPELPNVKRIENKKLRKEIKNRWIGYIYTVLKQNCISVWFEQATVFIRYYFPDDTIKDLDNTDDLTVSSIIDGIRYTGITKDDKWQNLSYFVDGAKDEKNPRTEIYVCDKIDWISKLYPYIKNDV